MSKYRRAAKVDRNQGQIVKALRAIPGVSVATRHDDILVGYGGQTFWYEIKKSATAEIKPSQKKLAKEWQGHYAIVWTADQIVADIRRIFKGQLLASTMPGMCLPRPADGLLRAVGAAEEGDGSGVLADEGKAVKG
jgi:hypothetical protein